MKKIILLSIAFCAVVTACIPRKSQDVDTALEDATREELESAVADRDSLLSLVNDISQGLEQIKSLQNILSVKEGTEGVYNDRTEILNDIAAIEQTMEQRKKRLEELEAKLKNSNLNNSQLKKTIETLRTQISEQAAEIESLRKSLSDANARIDRLNVTVDSLNSTVDTITMQRNAALEQGTQLANELNTCFYVAASSKELKEHNILSSGFLRKTKVMESYFDQGFFTKADKRTLRTINLHSKKAKLLTNQPSDSYEIIESNGQKILRILDPAKFWAVSNYLVIQID